MIPKETQEKLEEFWKLENVLSECDALDLDVFSASRNAAPPIIRELLSHIEKLEKALQSCDCLCLSDDEPDGCLRCEALQQIEELRK